MVNITEAVKRCLIAPAAYQNVTGLLKHGTTGKRLKNKELVQINNNAPLPTDLHVLQMDTYVTLGRWGRSLARVERALLD